MSDTTPEASPDTTPAGAPARRSRSGSPLPWYRRGVVWLWFVLATVGAAVWLSYWAEDRIGSDGEGAASPHAVVTLSAG